LAVVVNGTSHDQSHNAVRLTMHGPKKATVHIQLADLLKDSRESNSVTVSIADAAFDSGMLRCSLSFRQAPSRRLDDGCILSVDTVTPKPDWSEWWVVCNGVKMDSSFTTTRGHTWLSEASTQPHWLRIDFPEPRTMKGVAIWWAYWQCFRTSRAYEIQTWDGQRWVTQGTYTHDRDEQCSRHEFAPVVTSRVRFWQPANSGHPQSTGEVWLSEFEVL
jgi:hypothetical protein